MAYVTPKANGSAEWARVATRPVIGPGVNVWLLVGRPPVWHGTEEQIPREEVETAAADALAFWLDFPHRDLMSGLTILSTEASREPLSLARPSSERRESLPVIPTIAGSPWYVRIKFLSELARTSLPWPVITRDLFGWTYRPSSSAEWMLLQAETPRPPDAAEKAAAKTIAGRFMARVERAGNAAIAVGMVLAIATAIGFGLAKGRR